MDFSFTEPQQDLVELAARVFGDRVTVDTLRQAEAGTARFDPALWATLAETGLLGVALPEDVGGSGGGVTELCLILVEAGRRLAPVPLVPTLALAAGPIATAGTEEQRRRLLGSVIEGRAVLSAAFAEPRTMAADGPVRASVTDTGIELHGAVGLVPAATIADAVLVPAEADAGPLVAVVDPKDPRVRLTAQRTSGRDTAGRLDLDGVPVAAESILGAIGDGQRIVELGRQRGRIAHVALALGVLEEALRETAEYTSTRVQFDRPIATFQAVGHRCADCYIDVEGVRLTLWQALWRLDAGMDASLEVDVAAFWAAEAAHRVAHAAVHLHGGMGVATEHTTHRYFLAAKQIEFALGGATDRLLAIGRQLADTPA
jgi:alkylation response protein AidB-like acyl-CoA dehydrogenase